MNMATYNSDRTLQVLLLTLTLIGQVSTVNSSIRRNTFSYFTSRASQISAKRDQDIALVCSVAIGTETVKLDWWLLDYEVQLTSGSRQLLLSKKHSIHYVESSGNCTAILKISKVRPIDSGYYACRFENGSGSQEQISRLFVEGTLQIEDEFYDYEDMTGCCRTFGVVGGCLDLCSPFELFSPDGRSVDSLRQEFRDCGGATMLALMECGAGRNNIPCCLERNVSSWCSKLCNGILDDRDLDLGRCSEKLPDMALCFSRGLASIPPPTADIRATKMHLDSGTIMEWSVWTPWYPGNDEDFEPWFLVFRLGTDDELFQVQVVETNDSSVRLDSSVEMVVVVPANQHGASSRGAGFELGLPGALGPSSSDSTFSLSECCTREGVPGECQPILCGILVSDGNDDAGTSASDKCSCYRYVKEASKCLSANKMDSRDCCLRQKVSNKCLNLCSGNISEPNLGTLTCFQEMPYIRTCLEGGQGRYEVIPLQLLVSNITCCSATFSWSDPSKQMTSFHYILRYKEVKGEHFFEVTTSDLFVFVRGLNPGTEYEGTVVSALGTNADHRIILSNSIKFRTRLSPDFWKPKATERPLVPLPSQDPVVIVSNPSTPLIPIGHHVTLTCFSRQSKDSVACHWAVKSLIFDGAVLEIASTNETSSGVYTCVCGQNHKSYTLNVQSAPVFIPDKRGYKGISPQRVVRHPLTSHLAELTCHFSGFPDSVTWHKDGLEILVSRSPSSIFVSPTSSSGADLVQSRASDWPESPAPSTNGKYASTKYSLEDQGILYYKLSIEPFEPSDVGVYTCVGSNRYASDEGSVHLVTGNTIVEATNPKEHSALVSDCCKKSNISERCSSVCTFEVDPSGLRELSWECHGEFQLIMQCSSRGWNYSGCCAEVGVPRHCRHLCHGGGAVMDPGLSCDCINFANEIIACHSRGHSFTPHPPSYVNHSTLDTGLLVLRVFEPTENPSLLTGYLVNWTSFDDKQLSGHQVLKPGEESSYYGYQLEPFRSYAFTVQSYNRHSLSAPYTLAGVRVMEPPILEKPDITLAVHRGQQVEATWKEPSYVHLLKMDVRFYVGGRGNLSADDGSGMKLKELFKMEGKPDDRLVVSGPLESNRWYAVVARMQSANYRGPWSDVRRIFIPDGATQMAGLIVAVAVCMSVGTVVIIVAWILCVRFRRKKTLSQESVSFENSNPLEADPHHLQVHLPSQYTYLEFQNESDDHHVDHRTALCR